MPRTLLLTKMARRRATVVPVSTVSDLIPIALDISVYCNFYKNELGSLVATEDFLFLNLSVSSRDDSFILVSHVHQSILDVLSFSGTVWCMKLCTWYNSQILNCNFCVYSIRDREHQGK